MAKKTPAPKAPKKPVKELNENQLDKAVGGGAGRNPTTWGKPGGG